MAGELSTNRSGAAMALVSKRTTTKKSQLFRTRAWGCRVLNRVIRVHRDRIVLQAGGFDLLRGER